jgi:maleylpyruvate isomerase
MTAPALADSTRWLTSGTSFLLDQVDVAEVGAASLLPGWSNGHVIAHVARNADAVRRLLTWAQTGVETPMYPSPDDRVAEIERDAHRSAQVLRADAHTSSAEFAAAVATLDATAWRTTVRTARGRLIEASEVPWMRVKEVWLHAVDLGAPINGLPGDVAEALLVDVTAAFDAKDAPPSLRLRGPDGEWTIGAGELVVAGSVEALLAWLTGRSEGGQLACDEGLPPLPAWL